MRAVALAACLVGSASGLSVASSSSSSSAAGRRGARDGPGDEAFAALEELGGEAKPKSYSVRKVRTIPHEGRPWTQGLEFADDGRLVETSGDYPFGTGSFVRVVDKDTGVTVQKITDGLARPMFIEGIAELGGRWFASTYEDHVALEYDENFNFVKSHSFPYEGWGLTHGPGRKSFLATNSSEFILSLDPENFSLVSALPATCLGHTVPGLNELEFVDDFLGQGPALLGNVIETRVVLVLDPKTAKCTGAFHLQDLEAVTQDELRGSHVANGIAFSKQTGTLWVTGKNWENMFEIAIEDPGLGDLSQEDAISMLARHLESI
mmetsp:Transcript_91336/g.295358  ORF Transcript_91336/g.295358 Transcript_91336/m.295358 type:complete len:321 (+) Transcript_91336:75-1037(+)